METLTLTNFAGLNTKSPVEELGTSPVESPNLINVVMEEGTIFSRAGQNTRYNFNAPTDKVSSLYLGKLGSTNVNIAQIGTIIKKQGGGTNIGFKWWNESWGYCRKIGIVNTTQKDYTNLLLDLRLSGGFDYTNFKTNGEDIRFIPYNGSEPDVANYPNGLSYEIKVWAKGVSQTTLSADITATAETIPVVSTATYPTQGLIIVENEKIWYNGKDVTNFLQCMRGYEGTTAVAHILGKTVNLEGQIYVKIPFIKAQSTIDVYMYNGNAGAEAKSQRLGNYGSRVPQEPVYWWWDIPERAFKTYGTYNQHLMEGFDTGVAGNYSWGYHVKTTHQDSEKIKWELKIYPGNSNVSKMGFIVKLDETTSWNKAILFGLIYNPPASYFRGIDLKFYDTESLASTSGNWYAGATSYEWQVGSTYTLELIYNKARREFVGRVRDPVGTLIFKKTLTINFTPTKIYHGISWVWPSGFQVEMFWFDYDNLYNCLPDTVTQSLGTEIPKPTGADDVNWTTLYPNTNYPTVSEKPHQILSFLKNYIFITEDYDVLMWDGTTTVKVGGGKKAKFGLVHKNRLWLFNFPGLNQPTMVWYSNINKITLATDWQTNGIDNKEFINADDGFEILGVGLMSDSIAIHKGNGVWLWYGDIPNHAIKKLNIDVGCIAWRSIAEWENGQFFMSTKGVHFLRGSVAETPIIFTVDNIQSDNLADKIMPTFKNINSGAIQNSIGVMWNDRYFLAVPSYSSDVNDMILVLDYKRGWWSVWKLPTDAITGLPLYAISSMFVYTKTNELYIGTTIGQILLQGNRSFIFDDKLTDNGVDISNIYETGDMDLGSPNVRKRLRRIEPVYRGNMTLGIMVDKTNEQNWNLTDTTKTGLVKGDLRILKIGRFFRLKFSNIEKQLHSVTLHYEYLRN